MGNNPFKILGLSESATREELTEAYGAIRKKYEALRFEPGDVGAEACARLEEAETAFDDALGIIAMRESGTADDDTRTKFLKHNLEKAEESLKSGEVDKAQHFLDECLTRTAQWHYLQAAVFYKKGWASEAASQLDVATNMEPGNAKYIEARDAMRKRVKANGSDRNGSFYNEPSRGDRSYSDDRNFETSGRRGCSACDVCNAMICTDCCCECFGGDFISCC